MAIIPELRETLIIRADAGPRMGTGHVMRSLALAQAWQDAGGAVVFVVAEHVAKIDARLQGEKMVVVHLAVRPGGGEDIAATAETASAHRASWVVLDGYQFDGDFQRALKAAGCRVMALDDFGHCQHYWADIVLNQDVNATAQMYASRDEETRLLLGTEYVLLRREFCGLPRPDANTPPLARRLLVTLGGADPWNYTTRIVRALGDPRADRLEAVVVVGPGNPYRADVEAAAAPHADRIRVLCSPPNMPELMQACDLAISAGGSTMWELAYFRVPSMVLVLAENQLSTAQVLKRTGACRVLEDALELSGAALADEIHQLAADWSARAAYAEKFGGLIDGRGSHRVCEILRGVEKLQTCGGV